MKKGIKKVSKLLGLVFICTLLVQPIFANEPGAKDPMVKKIEKLQSKTISIGQVKKDAESFQVGQVGVPTYQCANVSYILLSDLKQAGANIVWDPQTGKTMIYDLNQPISETPTFDSLKENATAYLGRDTVYINYQEVPALFVEGKTLIPAKWITLLSPGATNPFTIVKKGTQIDEDGNIANLNMEGINLWFDGKDYVEEAYNFYQLQPEEEAYYKDLQYRQKANYDYVGFVITQIDGQANNDVDLHKSWLKNPSYHTIPVPVVVAPPATPEIKNLFPDTQVKGVMRRAAGGFAKGEEVNIFNATSGTAYHLLNKDGRKITVPWASVQVKTSPTTKEAATKEQIEQYANSRNFTSKTNYFVWTDVYRQRTYVLKGSVNKWELVRSMLSTTGYDKTPTPTGSYTLNVRVPAFGMDKGYRAKNAYGFIGTTYLYHSVIFDRTGSYLLGWGNLGSKGSAGCIRLSEENSAWFYKTMPIGTSILIK